MGTCSIEGCEKTAHARGWCQMHYRRWTKHGDPEAPTIRTYRPRGCDIREWLLHCRVIDPDTGCWLWLRTGVGRKGELYGGITIAGRTEKVHRVAYELFVGPIPEGHDILHSCDVKRCFNPAHLRPGLDSENQREAWTRGRSKRRPKSPVDPSRYLRGERNPLSKLTEDQVRAIRSDPRSQRAVARDYGVSRTAVQAIRRRETWAHVP